MQLRWRDRQLRLEMRQTLNHALVEPRHCTPHAAGTGDAEERSRPLFPEHSSRSASRLQAPQRAPDRPRHSQGHGACERRAAGERQHHNPAERRPGAAWVERQTDDDGECGWPPNLARFLRDSCRQPWCLGRVCRQPWPRGSQMAAHAAAAPRLTAMHSRLHQVDAAGRGCDSTGI